jgi:hypothetical protein
MRDNKKNPDVAFAHPGYDFYLVGQISVSVTDPTTR